MYSRLSFGFQSFVLPTFFIQILCSIEYKTSNYFQLFGESIFCFSMLCTLQMNVLLHEKIDANLILDFKFFC